MSAPSESLSLSEAAAGVPFYIPSMLEILSRPVIGWAESACWDKFGIAAAVTLLKAVRAAADGGYRAYGGLWAGRLGIPRPESSSLDTLHESTSRAAEA